MGGMVLMKLLVAIMH